MTGNAGSGKSTIANTVSHHFDNALDDEVPNILQATYCCSRQFDDTRQQKYIIPTLVYQLAHHSKSYARALLDDDKFDSVEIPSKQLQDLLVGPWHKSAFDRPHDLPPYLIVVDALDEVVCGGGLAFLQALLTTIQEGHLQGLKFLVTSREDDKVAVLYDHFSSDVVCRLHKVAEEDVSADILRYLDAELPLLNNGERAELARRAGGLFIYASSAVRYMTPHAGLTREEQLNLLRSLLSDRWDLNEGPETSLASTIAGPNSQSQVSDWGAITKGRPVVASWYTQTLLKKLPSCVDTNPVTMAFSIAKVIIEMKDVGFCLCIFGTC